MAEYEPQHINGYCAERDTHSDLARASLHPVGHHSVDTSHSEQKRGNCENAYKVEVKTAPFDGGSNHLLKSAETGHCFRVKLPDDTAGGRGHGSRVASGSENYREIAPASEALAIIDVYGRCRRFLKTAIADVAYDADNPEQAKVAIHVAEFNRSAQGVLVRPSSTGERFADDGDVRGVNSVPVVE